MPAGRSAEAARPAGWLVSVAQAGPACEQSRLLSPDVGAVRTDGADAILEWDAALLLMRPPPGG